MSYRQTQGKYFDCFLLSFRSTVKYYKNTDRSKPSLISRGVYGNQKGNTSIIKVGGEEETKTLLVACHHDYRLSNVAVFRRVDVVIVGPG